MKEILFAGLLMFSLASCDNSSRNSTVASCLGNPNGSDGTCQAPGPVKTVDDIFTFDLMPSSDKNSLQVALFWGMKTFHEVGFTDTGLTIEAFGDSLFTMQQDGLQLSCMKVGTEAGCGFTLDKTDLDPNPNILDIGTANEDDSVQSALMQFVFAYLTVVGEKGDLTIKVSHDKESDPIVFTTSTAKMTSGFGAESDGRPFYSTKIELLAAP